MNMEYSSQALEELFLKDSPCFVTIDCLQISRNEMATLGLPSPIMLKDKDTI